MARLLYDADCGFCTRSAVFGRRLGLRAEILPMQDVDLAAHGITETQARRALPFVTDDGVEILTRLPGDDNDL